jgi:hypothetical protein
MTKSTLPDKRPGKFYAVVLRRGYSAGRSFMAGAFGGNHDFPIPELGTRCVCCSKPAEGRVMRLEVSTDRWKAEPVATPVCQECTGHALGDVGSELAIAGLLCAGIGGTIWGVAEGIVAIGAAGVVLTAACGLWLRHRERSRVEKTRGGHFPGFQILIHPGQVVVRTSNRELARSIVEQAGALVHRVR